MKEGSTAWRNPFVSGHCVGLVPSLLYVCGWRDESLVHTVDAWLKYVYMQPVSVSQTDSLALSTHENLFEPQHVHFNK